MYELLDQIRQLEIELAQALNRAKDSVALLEEAVQRLKDHRLELEAGRGSGMNPFTFNRGFNNNIYAAT
jgi:hypothetical protein